MTSSSRQVGAATLATVLSAALFGTTGTARIMSKLTLDSVSVAAGRLLLGAIGLVVIVVVSGRGSALIRLWRTPTVWVMGIGVAAYQALFFVGTGRVGVAIGTLASLALGPLMAGLLAWWIGSSRPTAVWWTSTVIAIAGLSVLTVGGMTSGASFDVLGIVAAVGAGCAYAVYTVFGSKLAQSGAHATDVLAASFMIGGILLLPLGIGHAAQFASPAGIALILWLGIVATSIAYVMFGMGIATLPAGTVATLNLAEPVIATFLGVVVVGEAIHGLETVGCLLIAASLGVLAFTTMRGARD